MHVISLSLSLSHCSHYSGALIGILHGMLVHVLQRECTANPQCVQLGAGTRSCRGNVCARRKLFSLCIVYSKALPLTHPPRQPRSLHSLMHAHYAYEPLLLRGSQQLSAASVGHSAARSAERSARPIYTGTVALSVPPDASHTLLNALAMHTVRLTDGIIRTRRLFECTPYGSSHSSSGRCGEMGVGFAGKISQR